MITDAHEQGRLAFVNNHPMSSCRYPVGSDLRANWMAGWQAAQNAAPNSAAASHPGLMADARRAAGVDRPAAHES